MENVTPEILLIEDNEFDAELTIHSLKKNDISNNVVHVNSAQNAYDFLNGEGEFEGRNTAHNPKVILLDLKLGHISGVKVLEKIRANENTQHIPVVVLSGSREDTDLKKCYDLGANSYLVKPIEFGSFTKGILMPLLNRK